MSAKSLLNDSFIAMFERVTERLGQDRKKLMVEVTESAKLEDLTRIWNALQTPYRLSVCYEVRVVPIESKREQDSPRASTKTDTFTQV